MTRTSATRAIVPVVVDTREQRPYLFTPETALVTRAALPAGDYSVAGHETHVAFERKSLEDLVNTLARSRDRFFAEMTRLESCTLTGIIVEAELRDVLRHAYRSEMRPDAVLGLLAAVEVDHGVPVHWWGSRAVAQTCLLRLLARYWARVGRSGPTPTGDTASTGITPPTPEEAHP